MIQVRFHIACFNLVWMISIIITSFADAQSNDRATRYRASIKYSSSQPNARGLLYAVDSASVTVYQGNYRGPIYQGADINFLTIPAYEIDHIRIQPANRMQKSVTKGALIGGLFGLAFGGIMSASYSDLGVETTGEVMLSSLLSGLINGVIIGVITGSFKTKIPVGGNTRSFYYHKDYLIGHSIIAGENLIE